MAIRRHVVSVTTDGSGDATQYSPILSGELISIQYVKPGAASYTDGVDFTITAEATGETLWAESNVNATKYCYPRAAAHTTAGVASLYAAGGTPVNAPVCLSTDRVKIVLGSGGASKVGAFHIVVRD